MFEASATGVQSVARAGCDAESLLRATYMELSAIGYRLSDVRTGVISEVQPSVSLGAAT
jgi:hypothetical protein